MSILPYVTSGLPGIGGQIKQRAEDFRVDELPPDGIRGGNGRFAWFKLTKRGMTTSAAIGRVASFLGVKPREITFAGLKDANAVTSQWMSLANVNVRRLESMRDRSLRVSDIHFRPVSQKVGNLAGNRFAVRIRKVGRRQLNQAKALLGIMARRGVPNYFGRQRFGSRGDNAAMGEALVRGQDEEFLRIFLGRGRKSDPPRSQAAREAYDHHATGRALGCWAPHCVGPRNVLTALLAGKGSADAIKVIKPRIRQIYVQSYQSVIFNDILARRIETIDAIEPGEIVEDHATGKSFPVKNLAEAVARAAAFELSPTGLIPGRRMRIAEGEPGKIERDVMARHKIDARLFERGGAANVGASRRALRYRPADVKASAGRDRHGTFIEVAFTAPSGCYATVLLEELCKNREPYMR